MFSPQKLEIFPLLQPLSQKLILTSPIAFPIPIVTAMPLTMLGYFVSVPSYILEANNCLKPEKDLGVRERERERERERNARIPRVL